MQVRSVADDSILTGITENSADVQPHMCNPSTGGVTHTSRVDKLSISFQWTPTAGTGEVVFRHVTLSHNLNFKSVSVT